jgi:hypothetical protein
LQTQTGGREGGRGGRKRLEGGREGGWVGWREGGRCKRMRERERGGGGWMNNTLFSCLWFEIVNIHSAITISFVGHVIWILLIITLLFARLKVY